MEKKYLWLNLPVPDLIKIEDFILSELLQKTSECLKQRDFETANEYMDSMIQIQKTFFEAVKKE
jgi:hypothetical protein